VSLFIEPKGVLSADFCCCWHNSIDLFGVNMQVVDSVAYWPWLSVNYAKTHTRIK